MFCVFCGSNIAEGLAACPQCKAPLPARKPSKQPSPAAPPQAVDSRPHVAAPAPAQPPASAASSSETLVGRVLARRYRILGQIGAGAMGAVYKAEEIQTRRLAAIKLLAPDRRGDAESIARFQREARMASRISHPNAVRTFDAGTTEDGSAYIAMEYVEGEPLSRIIKAAAPLPLERVIAITWQAAAALHSGHELNVIHRDFKPDNVLLCRQPDGADTVKVLDFGLAKPTAVDPQFQELTQLGYVVGTPQYISPEQVKNEPVSARSDLYSLAIVVYEMLTGGLPFAGKTSQRQMFNRLLEEPMAMSVVNPMLALPPEVEMVVMKALSRRPEERYASTVEFAQALSSAAHSGFEQTRRGQTVIARPASPPPRPATPGYPPPTSPAMRPPASSSKIITVGIIVAVLVILLLLAALAYFRLR
ncbi:MAG: serine/threonine-protein kinase [Blastocatellia bacterium]